MAEERTEQATPRRREEARKRGDSPRSAELAGVAALLGTLLGIRAGWGLVSASTHEMLQWGLGFGSVKLLTVSDSQDLLLTSLTFAVRMGGPVALAAATAALIANLAQTGLMVTGQPLVPSFSRINLLSGMQRMGSRRSWVMVAQTIAKLLALCAVSYLFLRARWEDVLALTQLPVAAAASSMGALLWGLLVRVAGVMLVLALVDYVYQRRTFEQRIRMTKQEAKEESKRTEGDPLVKSRIRERQRAAARQRMMQAVKTATVVVVNPTHIAVALKYEGPQSPAPVVVAKGKRLMAARLRAEAEKHDVPVLQNVDLARALYRSVPVGRQIPPELYQAVAEIIAFVYRLARGRSGMAAG